LRVKAKYDDAFRTKFGADAVNAVRRILAFSQNYWKMSASLGTQIIFAVDPTVQAISGTYVAETDL
jgi:hypothetical protein